MHRPHRPKHTRAPSARPPALALASALLLVAVAAAPASARAQSATTASAASAAAAPGRDPAAARAAMDLARFHYGKHEYKEAARLFHQAYGLDPVPEYLFNAARAEQRGFDLDAAERDFLAFLALADLTDDVRRRANVHLTEVRETRAQLERAKAEGRPAPAAPPEPADAGPEAQAPTPAPAPAPSPGVRVAPPPSASDGGTSMRRLGAYAALAVGVAGVGVGIFQGVAVSSDQRALDRATAKVGGDGKIVGLDYAGYRAQQTALYDRRDRALLIGGLGALGLGAGVALLWSSSSPVQAAVLPRPGGALLTLCWGVAPVERWP